MAVLQQRSGSAPLPVFSLNADCTRIGRQADCEILLASEDVSRCHAKITRDEGRYIVEDLQSRNGTQVNGQTIRSPVVLEDGDEIQISSEHFAFLTDDPLLFDSSPSGYAPSVISLSGVTPGGQSAGKPLNVVRGDRIPISAMSLHNVNPDAVVARVGTGGPQGGWPTLRQPEDKLFKALHLQDKTRGAVSEAEVLSCVLEGLFESFERAERVAIVRRCPNGTAFEVAAASSREVGDEICISIPVLFAAMESGETLFCVEHERAESGEDDSDSDLVMRYLLASPLLDVEGTACGAVQVESRQSGGFEAIDAEFLAVLSHIISCRLDDSAAAAAAAGLALLNRSTETANRIRRQLVPARQPVVNGFQVRHRLMAVPDVAGDLVDYVQLSDGRLACFILDVPGRGPEAAGLMASIALVVSRTLANSASAAHALRMVENELETRMHDVPMITSLCLAILDPERSAVTLSVAGHCPVYHFHQEGVTAVSGDHMTGPPLGAPRDVYLDDERHLAADEILLLCSDGIARITGQDGGLASPQDVTQLLERAAASSRTRIEDGVAEEIEALLGGEPLQDDVVLLAIHNTNASGLDAGTGESVVSR